MRNKNFAPAAVAVLFAIVGFAAAIHHAAVGGGSSKAQSTVTIDETSAHCRLQAGGQLPDPKCTPGVALEEVTQANIHQTVCAPGYAQKATGVSASVRQAVFHAYGIADIQAGEYEIDYLVPVGLAGDSSMQNLWPESYDIADGAHQKDAVDARLHDQVCAGKLSLADAQNLIANDWRKGQ